MHKLILIAATVGLVVAGTVTVVSASSRPALPRQHYPASYQYRLQPAANPVITFNPQTEQLIDWTQELQPSVNANDLQGAVNP